MVIKQIPPSYRITDQITACKAPLFPHNSSPIQHITLFRSQLLKVFHLVRAFKLPRYGEVDGVRAAHNLIVTMLCPGTNAFTSQGQREKDIWDAAKAGDDSRLASALQGATATDFCCEQQHVSTFAVR
jgi:hypothetical protein